jgi:hypothetical protein
VILLFTDYGMADPYVGQIKAVLARVAPGVPVIDLLHACPDFNAHAGAHLLAALARDIPAGAVFFCVVDPGVGSPRAAVVVEADGQYFVGPDNGLMSLIAIRAKQVRLWRIDWLPDRLSDTFHGRDLFAPIAGSLAQGAFPAEKLSPITRLEVVFADEDLGRVLYIDHYGNAWTGHRAGPLTQPDTAVRLNGQVLGYCRTFAEAERGRAFWHVNSAGLLEICANRARADELLGVRIGDRVELLVARDGRLH